MKKDAVSCPGCGGSNLVRTKMTLRLGPLADGASLEGDMKSYACADCRLLSFFVSELDVPPLKRALAQAKPSARSRGPAAK